jgi:hypothetical protein
VNYAKKIFLGATAAHLEAVGGEQDGADADAGVDGGLYDDHEVEHPPGPYKSTNRNSISGHLLKLANTPSATIKW